MEIWKLQLTGEKQTGESAVYFQNFHDIRETLRTTYSACRAVDIVIRAQATGGPLFTVTGEMDYGGPGDSGWQVFRHDYKSNRLFVFDRATHL